MLRTDTPCPECASKEVQQKVALHTGKVGFMLTLPCPLLLAFWWLVVSESSYHWGYTVAILGITTLCLPVMLDSIRYYVIGHPLHIFPDERGEVHCEAAYPVSIEPSKPREKETLAKGRVLRVGSGLFRKDGYISSSGEVTPLGLLGYPVRLTLWVMDNLDPTITLTSRTMQLRHLDASVALLLLEDSHLLDASHAAYKLVRYGTLLQERDALATMCEELTRKCAELGAHERALHATATKLQASQRELERSGALAEFRATVLTDEILYTIGHILTNKSKRTAANHPGAIRQLLERALLRHLTAEQILDRVRETGPAVDQALDALRTSDFVAGLTTETTAEHPAEPAPPPEPSTTPAAPASV